MGPEADQQEQPEHISVRPTTTAHRSPVGTAVRCRPLFFEQIHAFGPLGPAATCSRKRRGRRIAPPPPPLSVLQQRLQDPGRLRHFTTSASATTTAESPTTAGVERAGKEGTGREGQDDRISAAHA